MFLINLLTGLATGAALTGSKACFFVFVDEPVCPKCLIK